ncbi:1473_t:CDS:2 [Entrophospora sp. SA101]|nr:1473_t:CDS:2 [Entrophospora sp. SA101]
MIRERPIDVEQSEEINNLTEVFCYLLSFMYNNYPCLRERIKKITFFHTCLLEIRNKILQALAKRQGKEKKSEDHMLSIYLNAGTRPIVTIAKNGVGAFILPCRMIVFNYCERGGSSRGIVEYLKNRVIDFAKENPQIEIKISPRPSKHPVIRGVYLNNKEKDICVKNMKINEIEEKVQLLKDSSDYM